MRVRFGRRLAVVVLSAVVVAGCTHTGSGDGHEPTPLQSPPIGNTSAPPYGTRGEPSDGGSVEVREVGFTVLGETTYQDSFVVWAAVIENTSRTDLLAYVSLGLTWRDGQGGTGEVSHGSAIEDQRAYDVLPGRTTVVGGGMLVDDLVPKSLEVLVQSREWYPMWALDARGISAGVEVISAEIDLGNLDVGGRVRAWVDYTSSYDSRPHPMGEKDLRLLLVMRDAAGALLGALPAAEFGVWARGQHRQYGSMVASRWLDGADAERSGAAITRVCCGWVGG